MYSVHNNAIIASQDCLPIDCEKSMKFETSPKVTKSKRSLYWCRSISKTYLCRFYYSISQNITRITLSSRRFIAVSGVFITLSGTYYIIGRFFITLSGTYYSIGRLLHYRWVQCLSMLLPSLPVLCYSLPDGVLSESVDIAPSLPGWSVLYSSRDNNKNTFATQRDVLV